jgi:hypothetical protein
MKRVVVLLINFRGKERTRNVKCWTWEEGKKIIKKENKACSNYYTVGENKV